MRGKERSAKSPAPRSTAKSADYPTLQYTWNRTTYPVPLPKLHDGAPASTIARRLQDLFFRKVRALREHQKDLHRAFEKRDLRKRHNKAFTCYWEMGSGKTLGATSLMVNHRSCYNMVICNNTNIGYWVDHIRKTPFITREEVAADGDTETMISQYGSKERDVVLYFDVCGYTAFRTEFDRAQALSAYNCVVLDEAHYFRNNTAGMSSAMHAIHSAKNVVLLTGTPLVNDCEDIYGMMALIDIDRKHKWDASTALPDPKTITAFLKDNVSWFSPATHRPNMFARHYPELVDHVERVQMTYLQSLQYLMALRSVFEFGPFAVQQGKSNRYNCLTRAVCNAPEDDLTASPKLQQVMARITENIGKGPQLVHSSLVETGVKPLQAMCEAAGNCGNLACITGSTATEDREGIRKAYNKGKIDVMYISDASQFGLDLMATRAIHLVEPHQNKQNESQTTARALRMGSHRACDYKTVDRFKYISVFPSGPMTKDDVAACKAFMIERRLFGNNTEAELTKLDVKKLLEAKIRAESKTINERQEEENARKQIEIEPYLDAFRRATVVMSTQKGAKLFDDPVEEDAPAAQVKATPKKMRSVACQTTLKGKDLDKLFSKVSHPPEMQRSKKSTKPSKQAGERFTYRVTERIPALDLQ